MVNVIQVYYSGNIEKALVGRLVYQNHKIYFEYSQDFLKSGLELSPFKLPLKPGIQFCEEFVFDGLFGVFNDSLPDGWGRLLLDRKLMALNINPGSVTPLERLKYVGRRGMGALSYEPEIDQPIPSEKNDLDLLAEEALCIQEQNGEQFVDELLAMNGSSAGARPKILVSLVKEDTYLPTNNQALNHFNDWIIKFRSSLDPIDVGPIEYAYHLMTKASGLDVPEARLFHSKKCPGYFGVKRFDRTETKLVHMHTVSGLLHADHRIPNLDYETLLKMTLWLTKDVNEVEKQFKNTVFNILSHNRDDHSKNFSFLMDSNGNWKVSPAYDLIFSSGPAGEHCTTIMKEGKNPGLKHLLKLAKSIDIEQNKALKVIDEIKEIVSKWPNFAKLANVSPASSKWIQSQLNLVLKNF